MTWIRAHYDRVSVLAAALFLFASALLVMRSVSQFGENFSALQAPPPPKPALPPPKAVELEQATERLRQPAQWTFSGRSGLFVPEKHFIDANGFSNLEEWQNHTKPTDKNSHPAFIAKLKMKSFVQEPFRLVFASWVDDTFAINTNDLKEPTQFLRLGDSIRGTKFKLVKFTEKFEPNKYGTKMDVSELTLENHETHEQLNLVKEKIMISPESVAHFVYAWGSRREFVVKKDQEFSLKPEEQIKYKLMDVQPAKAVIVNTQKPNEPIEVGLLIP